MIVPTVIGKCCMVVIGTKVKTAAIRKHSRSQFRPSMGSGLTSLVSQTTMGCSQRNICYRVFGSELSLK
ncbi:hypothetical protein TNCV_1560701 [Trichonephila clavipes]|nr:hypothetical protein TNCV_1560701 [Trichonephila clavipes]